MESASYSRSYNVAINAIKKAAIAIAQTA